MCGVGTQGAVREEFERANGNPLVAGSRANAAADEVQDLFLPEHLVDSDVQLTALADLLVRVQTVCPVDVVDRSDAALEQFTLPVREHVVDMARDVRLHETVAYRDGCGLAQNTGQFTVLVTNVRSAVWVRHVAVQAEFFESLGIEPQGVPVHGPQRHGDVRADRIQRLAIRHHGLVPNIDVPLPTEDPRDALILASFRHVRLQHVQGLFQGPAIAHVRLEQGACVDGGVNVRIAQPGQHRTVFHVGVLGAQRGQILEFLIITHRHDAVMGGQNGVRVGSVRGVPGVLRSPAGGRIHGVDLCIVEQSEHC